MPFFYILSNGLSGFGDWLFLMATRWYQVNDLSQALWLSALTILGAKLLRLPTTVIVVRRIEQMSAWKVIASGTALLALCSATLAWTAATGRLDGGTLAAIAAFSSAVGGFIVGHVPRLQREILGERQQDLAFWESWTNNSARIVAGILGGKLGKLGTWTLFALDAVSFLPLIIYLLFSRKGDSKSDEGSLQSPPASVLDGTWYIWRNPALRMLVTINTIRGVSFMSLPFIVTPEIVKRDYAGGATEFGIWLAVTGGAGLLGSIVGKRLRLSTKGTVGALAAAGVSIAATTAAINYAQYIICYLCFVGFIAPAAALMQAELQLVDTKYLASVRRVSAIVEDGISPASIVFITWLLGAQFHIGPRQILFVSSLTGLLALGVLTYLAKTRGLMDKMITGKYRNEIDK